MISTSQRKYQSLFIDLVMVLVILLIFLLQTRNSYQLPFYWDTASFLIPTARDMAQTGQYFQYMAYATDYPHTPLLPMIFSLCFKLLPQPLVAVHVLSSLFSIIFLLSIYLITRRFLDKKLALASLLLYVTSPLFIAQTEMAYFEIIGAALRFLTIYALMKNNYRVTAIIALLAFMVRFENGIILGFVFTINALLAHNNHNPNKSKRNYQLATLMLLVNSIWLIFHKYSTGWWLYSPLRYFDENHWQTLLNILQYLFYRQGRILITITGATAGFLLLLKLKTIKTKSHRKKITNYWLLLASSLPTIFITIKLGYFLPRYIIPVLPLFYLSAVWLVRTLIWQLQLKPSLKKIILLMFLAGTTLWQTQNKYDCFSPVMEDCQLLEGFLSTKQQAANYIISNYSKSLIITDFPEDGELSHPFLGYSDHHILTRHFLDVDWADRNKKIIYISPTSSEGLLKIVNSAQFKLKHSFIIPRTSYDIEIYEQL